MPPSLDLELVRTFLAVLEAGSFKAAAARLNKTPAAVSMQIKRLEEVLGAKVLERSNQGMSLTTSGVILRGKGQRLMALNYELLGDLRENEITGQLRFGAPADYASTLLGQLLPIFSRELPKVTPHIVLALSRQLRQQLASGLLDMAIVACETDMMSGHDLWTEQVAWFGTAVAEDGRLRVGLLAADCILRDMALEALVETDHVVVLESPSVTALGDAVAGGFCRALLPVSAAAGLERADAPVLRSPATICFCLLVGPRFETTKAEHVAQRFRGALSDSIRNGNP